MGKMIDFMRQAWDDSDKKCAECGVDLIAFSPVYMSHHISKGAAPKLKYDKENIDVLCYDHHYQWEFGDKKSMKIYDEDRIHHLRRKENE